MMQTPLPIDPLLPEIVATLRRERSLVLEAPPGAGKTTRVPRALVEAGLGGEGEIVVLQPRRLPTRLAARRVAEELGEEVGQTVGYQVRFEDISSKKTQLRFVTEGVLGRRLLTDPELRGVSAVVLDEFHERHLTTDLSLALLRRLQETKRPELRLVVMSATLEAGPIATYLGGCPSLRSEGRRFEVAVEYLPTADDRHLDQQVLSAMKRVLQAGLAGDVLVFLPGAGEIRRAREALEELAQRHGIALHALHGELSPAEQDRAVRPGGPRKVILSTNVAETSVTIEGVAVVIDAGLARVASHSPWSGLPTLKLSKVSRASAIQRAGRAGRTQAGTCLRLYTRHDFDSRPEHDAPEIRRVDLADTVLALRSMGISDLATFPFFEAPPSAALVAAETLLRKLGAVGKDGALTDTGRRLLSFPLHPRQARLIVEGERKGVGEAACALAAMLGERDIRKEARASFGPPRGGSGSRAVSGPSDLLELLERFREAERAGFSPGRISSLQLEPAAVQAVERVRRQLMRALPRRPRDEGRTDRSAPGSPQEEEALLQCVLAGYPDRLAKRRKANAPDVLIQGGVAGTLAETSVVREAELLIAVDAEERSGKGGPAVLVRLASRVEAEWLLDGHAEELTEEDSFLWNAEAQRVDRITRLAYGGLSLEEARSPALPGEATSRVLLEAARAAGPAKFADPEEVQNLLIRLEVVRQAFPEAGLPSTGPELLDRVFSQMAQGARSFEDMRSAGLIATLHALLSPEQGRLLASHTPERVALPGNRQVRVTYERDKPPFIESRLQDFFGMAKGPSICGGRVPLVLHLLAPNQRAVQVTTDLAGFWERHYPALRKELMRKYPRHMWPEDPTTSPTPSEVRGPGKRR